MKLTATVFVPVDQPCGAMPLERRSGALEVDVEVIEDVLLDPAGEAAQRVGIVEVAVQRREARVVPRLAAVAHPTGPRGCRIRNRGGDTVPSPVKAAPPEPKSEKRLSPNSARRSRAITSTKEELPP